MKLINCSGLFEGFHSMLLVLLFFEKKKGKKERTILFYTNDLGRHLSKTWRLCGV